MNLPGRARAAVTAGMVLTAMTACAADEPSADHPATSVTSPGSTASAPASNLASDYRWLNEGDALVSDESEAYTLRVGNSRERSAGVCFDVTWQMSPPAGEKVTEDVLKDEHRLAGVSAPRVHLIHDNIIDPDITPTTAMYQSTTDPVEYLKPAWDTATATKNSVSCVDAADADALAVDIDMITTGGEQARGWRIER